MPTRTPTASWGLASYLVSTRQRQKIAKFWNLPFVCLLLIADSILCPPARAFPSTRRSKILPSMGSGFRRLLVDHCPFKATALRLWTPRIFELCLLIVGSSAQMK